MNFGPFSITFYLLVSFFVKSLFSKNSDTCQTVFWLADFIKNFKNFIGHFKNDVIWLMSHQKYDLNSSKRIFEPYKIRKYGLHFDVKIFGESSMSDLSRFLVFPRKTDLTIEFPGFGSSRTQKIIVPARARKTGEPK